MSPRVTPDLPDGGLSNRAGRRVARALRSRRALAGVFLIAACGGSSGGEAPAQNAGNGSASFADLPRTDLTLEDREAWHDRLGWSAECEEAFRLTNAGDDAGLAFHTLSPGVSLLAVRCASAAYQPSWVFLRIDERGPEARALALSFPVFESPDGEAIEPSESVEVWGEPTFDPATNELILLRVSRQTRDCGLWVRYALDAEGPRPLELYARLPCPTQPTPAVEAVSKGPPEGWTRIPVNGEEPPNGKH